MTPPAPGRFSTTTDWPHCFDTTSPSVRARMSTRAAGGIGHENMHGFRRKRRLRGCRCRRAASTANATAAIRNHLPMASLPIFLLSSLIARRHAPMASPPAADHGIRSGHVDNPADRVKFRRHNSTAAATSRTKHRREARENSMAAADGQTHLSRRPEPGTAWCCNRSSATTSGWCPMCPTAC